MVFTTIGSSPVEWAGKTHSAVSTLAAKQGSVLIVPVGSLEQHGHHLPAATDTILGDAVACRAAEQSMETVPVLVTPPVWTGHSPHHLSFGGTVSLRTSSLLTVLTEIAETALENGFDALLFLNGHGGNMATISNAVSEVGADTVDREILGLTYFGLAEPFIEEIRESEPGGISHGGEFETSLMLHLRPELVDRDAIEATMRDEPYEAARQDLFEDGPLTVYRSFDEYSSSGAIGDPRLATAEKGEELFERLTDELGDLLVEIHTRNGEQSDPKRENRDEAE